MTVAPKAIECSDLKANAFEKLSEYLASDPPIAAPYSNILLSERTSTANDLVQDLLPIFIY